MNTIMVITTINSIEKAAEIAKDIVEKRLAACVQISSPVRSYYIWQGELQEDEEVQMFIKTSKSRYKELENRIKELHSYEVPEIIAIDISDGNEDYIKWVNEMCSDTS